MQRVCRTGVHLLLTLSFLSGCFQKTISISDLDTTPSPTYAFPRPLVIQEWRVQESSSTFTKDIYTDGVKEVHYLGVAHGPKSIDAKFGCKYDNLEADIQIFRPDAIILEGIPSSLGYNPATVIKSYNDGIASDPLFHESTEGWTAIKLALAQHIDFIGAEPTERESFKALRDQGFSEEDIVGYYFLDAVLMFQKLLTVSDCANRDLDCFQDHLNFVLQNFCAPDTVGHFSDIASFNQWFRSRVSAVFGNGHPLSIFDFSDAGNFSIAVSDQNRAYTMPARDIFYDDVIGVTGMPLESKKNKLTVMEQIFKFKNNFRDRHFLEVLEQTLRTHNRVVIVAGDAHRIFQAPVLRGFLPQTQNTAIPSGCLLTPAASSLNASSSNPCLRTYSEDCRQEENQICSDNGSCLVQVEEKCNWKTNAVVDAKSDQCTVTCHSNGGCAVFDND